MYWQTSRRKLMLDRCLVMGILNVTPDSFSDGGRFVAPNAALRAAEQMVNEGADIIDAGGESTRPGSTRVTAAEEMDRVVPVIESIRAELDVAISIDTHKSEVAAAAVAAGAEIINDISALRFDAAIAKIAAEHKTGLVLMHSLGDFDSMHGQKPVANILETVTLDLRSAVDTASAAGVQPESIVLDVGVGFGKSLEQNLALIADLDKLVSLFAPLPLLVGVSRKSFIAKLSDSAAVEQRLPGSLAAAAVAVWNGAKIVRAHDVKETVQCIRVVDALRGSGARDQVGLQDRSI